jgi:hypothetical protein
LQEETRENESESEDEHGDAESQNGAVLH